jgi:hypothetical protein
MIARYIAMGLAVTLACRAAAGAESVRVDASSGAPRLLVDGKPVRARIFWGAPGSRPLRLEREGREVVFEFSPIEDELHTATMHFRFGSLPGNVWLDGLRVVELGTGREVLRDDFQEGMAGFGRSWNVWPPRPKNTVGTVGVEAGRGHLGTAALHVALRQPPDGYWPDFHIYHQANLALRKGQRYRVSFWARAEPPRDLTVAFYRPGQPYVFLGGPPGVFESQIRLAAAVGVNFVSFPVDLPWPEPGRQVEWSAADDACQTVLEANPKALLLPRIGMDPPEWWRQSHPGETMVWDKTGPDQLGAVVASPEYRRDAAERLAALVRHLEEKFGPHVAGYHPCGQNTGEWFYKNTWESPLSGYARRDLLAWRAWLVQHYRDDAAIQAAWRDPRATRESAEVPSPAARRAAPAGVLRDPATERSLIDFAEFQQEAMAQCVLDLAHAVRQASRGRKLVLFFYGYVFEFGAIANGPATAGHYALGRVLGSPDIDVLCSPISYFDRGLGESAPAMTAAESVALAGKMWLYEDDTRTYLGSGNAPGWTDAVETLELTNRELLRNTAQCALRNFGTWWMDLGATGWFNDPGMWAQMKRLAALDEPLLESPRPFRPEVAVAIDEASMIRVAAGGQVATVPGVYEARRPLGRMGAPYGQYLLDDVTAGRVRAKMYVLLTAWSLSPAQRQRLLAATRGGLRIWCYAPGYLDQQGVSLDAMRELTGFRIKKVSPGKAQAEPTAAGKRLGLHSGFGIGLHVAPLFAAADATAEETLATYADGSAAIALRETAAGPSLFVGPPGLTSELLRAAARRAGVHLFTQADCNVYANGPYLVLHASQDGPLEIDVGRPAPVRDLLTGEPIGQGPKMVLRSSKGDTRVLVIGEKSP